VTYKPQQPHTDVAVWYNHGIWHCCDRLSVTLPFRGLKP
jgi:hypothetical protein